MRSIFVSIANYRDTETLNTVSTLVGNSSGEFHLRVCVFSQCHSEEEPDFSQMLKVPYLTLEAWRVDPWESSGLGWARSLIQKNYQGENFYLQIDSHVQLETNWDQILVDQLSLVSCTNPSVITAYLPGYTIVNGTRPVRYKAPTSFNVTVRDGIPVATSCFVDQHDYPKEALFFSGHFSFGKGSFVEDVPYDPEIFFLGEEISMAIRAYTSGYKLYQPCRYIGSHLYNRVRDNGNSRPLYWNADDESHRSQKWRELDFTSKSKVRAICKGEWFGKFGIRDSKRYDDFRHALYVNHGVDLKAAKAEHIMYASASRLVEPERTVTELPCQTHSSGRLTIVGIGTTAIAQMTQEAIAEIAAADVVFYNSPSPVVSGALKRINTCLYNLYCLYDENKLRSLTYIQMTEVMLREVRRNRRVVGAFLGHPGFFVASARRAMHYASIEGFPVRMFAGVSSLDNMIADLGIDPGAFGLQVLKASAVLNDRTLIASNGHVAIIQVGAVGDSGFSFSGFKNAKKSELFSRLAAVYGDCHECVYYKAADLPGFSFKKKVFILSDLAKPELFSQLHGGSLYIPPKSLSFAQMQERQISQNRRAYRESLESLPSLEDIANYSVGYSSPELLSALDNLIHNRQVLEEFQREPLSLKERWARLSEDEFRALLLVEMA